MSNNSIKTIAISQFITDSNSLINDVGSRATSDLSLWMPDPKQLTYKNVDYFYLGFYPTGNYGCPPVPQGPIICCDAYDDQNTVCLQPPTAFSTIWECIGNGAPSNLGIYAPVPPEGYIAIGCIGVMNFNSPPKLSDYNYLRCIRQDLAIQVTLTQADLIWTDGGSHVGNNVSIWLLPNSKTAFAMQTQSSQGYPATVTAYDINPNSIFNDERK